MQDISREIPTYPDPIYRSPPKLTEIPLQEIPRNLTDLDTDINTDFKENCPIKKVSYQKYIKDPVEHFSRNHKNWIVLIIQVS